MCGTCVDGEPRVTTARIDEQTATDTWWRSEFSASNRSVNYRFLLEGGEPGYAWLTGAGLVHCDVPDADDFVVAAGAEGPDWHPGSVVYEIYPDRFAPPSNGDRPAPDWAQRRDWDALPDPDGMQAAHELFGGDLEGIRQHLDHVEALGANVLYLTPFFPAGSTHRYDATSFAHVDPLLGGDEALARLTRAAHDRGMRVVGDLTLNHVGVGHEWFHAARDDPTAAERDFFLFDDESTGGYVSWYGIPSLPKLDYRSQELRRRLFDGPASVTQRWLRDDDGLDGWRIDVANMTGRLGTVDLGHEVARQTRSAVRAARADGLAVAEHNYDARLDLQGDGWHGVMNYSGFLRPTWCWLRGDELPERLRTEFLGLPVGVPRLGGPAAAETMRRFRAGVPWQSVVNSWLLLDSHDTARFGVVAGARERQLVGIGLQMTTPGVPMVWAGDEIGLGGDWGEDARRPMPWDKPETWDTELLEAYRRLIALRRSLPALARGGIRYAHVDADAIAYLRETCDERLLCLARRGQGEPVRLLLDELGATELESLAAEGRAGEARIVAREVVLPSAGPAFHVWRIH